MNSKNRKAASVALVALALVGLRTASAAGAELGGAEVLIGDAQAEQCSSSAVEVSYDVAYVAAVQGYGVSEARLAGLDERCEGYDVVVTLSGPGGAPLAQLTAVVDGEEMVVAVPAGTPVSAEQLTGVSVVLSENGEAAA